MCVIVSFCHRDRQRESFESRASSCQAHNGKHKTQFSSQVPTREPSASLCCFYGKTTAVFLMSIFLLPIMLLRLSSREKIHLSYVCREQSAVSVSQLSRDVEQIPKKRVPCFLVLSPFFLLMRTPPNERDIGIIKVSDLSRFMPTKIPSRAYT